VLRRAVASGLSPSKIVDALTIFSGASRIEGVHPLQFCYVRRKMRRPRRSGMRIANPLVFYPWRIADFVKVAAQWLMLATRYRRIMKRVLADANGAAYMDEALRPPAATGENADFVAAFADKIPHTHGAPTREPVAIA